LGGAGGVFALAGSIDADGTNVRISQIAYSKVLRGGGHHCGCCGGFAAL